eukprot:5342764-Prymnesium_polylepis.1
MRPRQRVRRWRVRRVVGRAWRARAARVGLECLCAGAGVGLGGAAAAAADGDGAAAGGAGAGRRGKLPAGTRPNAVRNAARRTRWRRRRCAGRAARRPL